MSKRYRVSPSVLDKMQRVLESEEYFESDFNIGEDGYKQSLEEIIHEREQDLLDAINQVPRAPIEAAAQGTAFNECVDQCVKLYYTGTDYADIMDKSGRGVVKKIHTDESGRPIAWETECDGFSFTFDANLVSSVAYEVSDGTMQLHIQAELTTNDGDTVLLHGYPDYIQPFGVTDLKTTSSYVHGKYERYWQRFVYPYILLKNKMVSSIDLFRFLVVEIKKNKKTGIISGELYEETYTDINTDTLSYAESELASICSILIKWCNDHAESITNQYYLGYED